jgi:RimJ/RimL family protein N-acetyltransferase
MTIPELEDDLQALVLMDGSPKKLHHSTGSSDLKHDFPKALSKYVTPSQLERAEKLFANLPYNDQSYMWVRDHFHSSFHPTFIPTKIPVLLLTGSLDEITPLSNFNGTPYLNRSNIMVHEVEGASHFPWLEQPEEVNQWLNVMAEIVLTTKRLFLRRFQTSDLANVAELLADPLVMKSSLKGPLSKEEAKEYLYDRIIGHYQKWGIGPWGIFLKEDGGFLGMAGLLMQEIEGHQQVEIAYRLFPRFWKKGYAVEAALAIRDWGFERLEVSHLISIIEPSNEASIRVAEKLGMVKVKNTDFHGFDVGVYRVRPIRQHPFEISWHSAFLQEERQLKEVLEGFPIQFFHIGSTSIDGCAAKPIIDILGVVPDIFSVDEISSTLEKLGYDALGEFGMPHRRYFTKYAIEGMPVHLHVFEDTDPEVGRHLRFRDYLSAHHELIEEYCAIKDHQAKEYPLRSDLYTMGKSAFIERVDKLAAREGSYGIQWKQSPRREQWSHDQLVKSFFVNWQLFHLFQAKYTEGIQWVYNPDLTVIESQDEVLVFGANFEPQLAKKRVQQVIKEHAPLNWWIGELDRPAHLEKILKSEGLQKIESEVVLFKKLDHSIPQPFDASIFKTRSLVFEGAPWIDIYKEKETLCTLLLHANAGGIYDADKEGCDKEECIAYCEEVAKLNGFHISFSIAKQTDAELLQNRGYRVLTEIKRYYG